MLHQPLSIRPLGSEQRIGKTKILFDGSQNALIACQRKRNDWNNDLPCSCAATRGSDILGDNFKTDVTNVDVTKLKTALNIVYSYDSSKDLKLPLITERKHNVLIRDQSFMPYNSLVDNYREQIKVITGQNNRTIEKITGERIPSLLPWETIVKKDKDNGDKFQKKKEFQPKTILKKTAVLQKQLEAGDSCIGKKRSEKNNLKRADTQSNSSKNTQSSRQEIGDAHRVSFKFPAGRLSAQPSQATTASAFLSVNHLPTIAENVHGEQDDAEKMKECAAGKSREGQGTAVKREHPTTQHVHNWLVTSSLKVLATKETFITQMSPRDFPVMSGKMTECQSGVIGLTENAIIKRKIHRGRILHGIRHGSPFTKTSQSSKGKDSVHRRGRYSSLHCNTPTSASSSLIEHNWSRRSAPIDIIPYDNATDPEFTDSSYDKLGSQYLSNELDSEVKTNPSVSKPSKQKVQKRVSSLAPSKEFNKPVPHSSSSDSQRKKVHRKNLQERLTKRKKRTGKMLSKKKKNLNDSKEDKSVKRTTSDLINSWIMELTYG